MVYYFYQIYLKTTITCLDILIIHKQISTTFLQFIFDYLKNYYYFIGIGFLRFKRIRFTVSY